MLGDSLRRTRASEPKPPRARRDRFTWLRGIGWGRWLLIALVVVGISFVSGFLLSVYVVFPAPQTAGTGIAVPELYGLEWSEAQEAVEAVGLALGQVNELHASDTPEGEVLAQAPVPGQQLRPGASVDLVVSAGARELRVPPVAGLGVGAARELLESAGFDVAVEQVTSELPEGVVAAIEPAAGTVQRLPAALTLMASVGPPPDTLLADTLPADTLADTAAWP